MKKLMLIILTALMMAGCEIKQTTENMEAPFGGNVGTTTFQTILIDSCEYITGSNKLAHKGNCRFCKERRQQEIKELIKELKEE